MLKKRYETSDGSIFRDYVTAFDHEMYTGNYNVRMFDNRGHEVHTLAYADSFVIDDREGFEAVRNAISEFFGDWIFRPNYFEPRCWIVRASEDNDDEFDFFLNCEVWDGTTNAHDLIMSYPENCMLRYVLRQG